MIWAGELASRLAREVRGPKGGGARRLQGFRKQSLSTQQALEQVAPMRFQPIPDCRSMPKAAQDSMKWPAVGSRLSQEGQHTGRREDW